MPVLHISEAICEGGSGGTAHLTPSQSTAVCGTALLWLWAFAPHAMARMLFSVSNAISEVACGHTWGWTELGTGLCAGWACLPSLSLHVPIFETKVIVKVK